MTDRRSTNDEIWNPPAGCALDALGMQLVSASGGDAEAQMEVAPIHLNQVGVLQGGIAGAFSDAVAGWATYGDLEEGATFATVQMQTHMLRAVRSGQVLLARARTVHAGRRVAVIEVTVVDRDDPAQRPVAHFTCTQVISKPE